MKTIVCYGDSNPHGADPAGVAAGFGLGLAFMIFAFGHISGFEYHLFSV